MTEQLARAVPLSTAQIAEAIEELIAESVPVEGKAEFLAALSTKGETPAEIADFARELRARSIVPPLSAKTRAGEILDVCGTGGDRLNTFNISTTVALIAAAAGIAVAKHGNRAITSQSGSADVLEELGVRIDLDPEAAAAALDRHHFAFFFAPRYHPAFRHIGPARKLCAERGQRTIFNFLGPLLNPVRPTAQLIGVPNPDLCKPMAQVLQSLGARRGMVVSGRALPGACAPSSGVPISGWLDEISTLGETTIAEFYQDRGFNVSVLGLEGFPIQAATLADLTGGDRATNAAIVRAILRGEDRGPRRDAVLLNAAAALFVGGKSRTLSDGWDLAAQLIDAGSAQAKLRELSDAA